MKVKQLLKEAQKELNNEQEKAVKDLVKTSLKQIAALKKTLKEAEEEHKELLNMDIDDIETDDMVW